MTATGGGGSGGGEGFTRCHCDACGHDLLVAFSCKSRTVCPSCAGRRMANTASAIVDRVLPDVPVRQYVLSLPYELRRLAAFKADVLTALGRVLVDAVFASYRRRAGRQGIADGQCGAINFVHYAESTIMRSERADTLLFRGGADRFCSS